MSLGMCPPRIEALAATSRKDCIEVRAQQQLACARVPLATAL